MYYVLEEYGFYSAAATYGLIVVWTVLARLRRRPRKLVRLVHWPLDRLGRIPVIGRAVNACRRYPLTLGLVVAILVGVAVPWLMLGAMWLIYALSLLVFVVLGVWAYFYSDDDVETYGAASGNYHSHYDDEIVSGHDPYADKSRPTLGNCG